MKLFQAAVFAAAIAATPSWVLAVAVNVTAVQVGSDVLMFGGGAIDTSAFGAVSSGTARAGVSPSVGSLNVGPATSVSTEFYSAAIVTAPIFGSPILARASSGSGDILALFDFGGTNFVGLPPDYDSGSPLSFESFYPGETLASLGLTSGLYGYLLAGGEVITVNIHAPADVAVVPSPATLPLLAMGLAFMGLAGTGRRWPRRA